MNSPLGLAAVALSAALTAGAAPNLAPNSSFEETDGTGAVSGWTADSAGMATVSFGRDAEVKHSGAASGRIVVAPAEALSWPAYSVALAVQPGQCYRAEAWVRTRDVERLAYLAADYLAADGKRVSFTSSRGVNGTTTDWQQVTLVAAIPEGTARMSLRLILHGTGTAWFDDVALARDEEAERALAKLREPLPAEWVARATTSEGNAQRLQRLFQAADRGGKFTFGVIGGSITQGAAASSVERRYPATVVRWLKERFPNAEWAFVNAGIGATGTNYGCLRAQRDLLSKLPDLVVTEYAVNDGNTQECAETYEGLLRQILASPRQPAVVMLFMMNQSGGNAQEWQSKLGRHYGLPMLSYRDLFWPEIEAKRLAWTDISPDAVHPNDAGHASAGKLITAFLERVLATVPAEPVPAPADALPAALLTDTYQATGLFEADALTPVANTGWTYDASNAWVKAWKASVPGSVMEFEITGEQLFVSYWRIRGPMGRARLTIDGERPSVLEAWFEQTWGGYRHMIRLPTGGPGKHRVRLEVLAEKHADSAGTEFRLLCLGTAGK